MKQLKKIRDFLTKPRVGTEDDSYWKFFYAEKPLQGVLDQYDGKYVVRRSHEEIPGVEE